MEEERSTSFPIKDRNTNFFYQGFLQGKEEKGEEFFTVFV